MAIPWNEDDPRDAALIVQNLTNLLRQIARRARLRQPPTVEMAQDWHRQIYKGVRLPVPYYAGEIRDSDSRFPELYGYEVRVGPQPGVESSLVPREFQDFETAMGKARDTTVRFSPAMCAAVSCETWLRCVPWGAACKAQHPAESFGRAVPGW